MHQSVADPKYEGVRTSRKELTEIEEEDKSGEDDEESHHEEDEESEKGRVRFDVLSEKQSWKSNGAISDEDLTSESEDGSEASQRGDRDMITSNRNNPSKQQLENLGPTEDVSLTLKKKREEDLEKGQAVKRQVVCPFCLRVSVCPE
jgi:protein AATF/BFR2